MIDILSYQFTVSGLLILGLVALLVGMAKTGVAGAGMIAVPLLAMVFGGRESTGIMLPMLIIADVLAVRHYHNSANWEHLKKLLPFAVIGVFLGTVIGGMVNDKVFKLAMAAIIFASLGIMIWQERTKDIAIPDNQWFAKGTGVLGGITTMIGNLAGPVMAVYLLAMRFPKEQFIGTAAWFFMTINVIKLPFHAFAWKTITLHSLALNLLFLPMIGLGAYIGIKIISLLPEQAFRHFVIAMTGVAAISMLF
ncbi:sulfite exporter TauE/SafE family protein [Arenicella sp. 4NH20-0111]|uniref:sulfite exporter TauE/SafE family protein n=1 Tax=Arenicella sp. 4NH20-0111 TaxID=3127648 RepID=UPI003103475A